MKIIDLLNKIANDDDFRPNVKYRRITYTYKKEYNDYKNDVNDKWGIFNSFCINMILNDEVEIIEEEKEIEKITEYDLNQCESLYDVSQFYKDKVNKLIDAVNEIRKEKQYGIMGEKPR